MFDDQKLFAAFQTTTQGNDSKYSLNHVFTYVSIFLVQRRLKTHFRLLSGNQLVVDSFPLLLQANYSQYCFIQRGNWSEAFMSMQVLAHLGKWLCWPKGSVPIQGLNSSKYIFEGRLRHNTVRNVVLIYPKLKDNENLNLNCGIGSVLCLYTLRTSVL